MEFNRQSISLFFSDSLVRGFALTYIFLLGIGLEQSLLPGPHRINHQLYFLLGNTIGLPAGAFLWTRYYPKSNLPLYFWPVGGLLVGLSVWSSSGFLTLLQGLVFGSLIFHLILLGIGRPFKDIVQLVGGGLILGNLLLLCLGVFPAPLGLIWLAVALAGWRIKRPCPSSRIVVEPIKLTISNPFIWLFLFFLFFYFIGGCYFFLVDFLMMSFSYSLLPVLVKDLIYVAGILSLLFFNKKYLGLFPYIAIIIMGIGLILILGSTPFKLCSVSMINFSFGIMDCLAVSMILSFTETLSMAVVGFLIFPIAQMIGLVVSLNFAQASLVDVQWALAILFFTLIPLLAFRATKAHDRDRDHAPASPLAEDEILPYSSNDGRFRHAVVIEEDSAPNHGAIETWKISSTKKAEQKRDIDGIAMRFSLSRREKQVFQGLIAGKKLKEIAEELGLAIGTIKAITNRIYEKAGVRSKKELLAQIEGDVQPEKSL